MNETLAILERHLPELEAALTEHGLETESFELGLGFSAPDGRPGEANDGGGGPGSRDESASSAELEIDHTRLARALARRAGLDTYA